MRAKWLGSESMASVTYEHVTKRYGDTTAVHDVNYPAPTAKRYGAGFQ
ncbi:hypothetical protein SYN63AY4M1_12060 [Synechococcus sp. 63AY4M1]|nr:hypothetical protein SYN63AY4M1_12060 [Synechococcus sp. 63AY4M1]